MSDKASKPSIPAWQTAHQSNKASEPTPSEGKQETEKDESAPNSDEAPATTPDLAVSTESSPGDEQQQLEQIRAFLSDPSVKDQPIEKKRTFLESKNIPTHLIDQELKALSTTPVNTADFESFRNSDQSQSQASSQHDEAQQSAPPPIITYPEFLAKAHRPPPIITPARIINTAYAASATATLIWAASKFLIRPMSAQLTDSRHEFASHGQSKIDELNARLEKIVSRLPPTKSAGDADDDDSSIASDPTELFHRDMGTQTDTALQNDSASSEFKTETPAQAKHAERLGVIQSHLSEMLKGMTSNEDTTRGRQENISKLRHYLDTLTYGGSAYLWNGNGSTGWSEHQHEQQKDKKEDAVDAFKKEIRSVKGVLLSAKRFPAAGAGGHGHASRRIDTYT